MRYGDQEEMERILQVMEKFRAIDNDFERNILAIPEDQRMAIAKKQMSRALDMSKRLSQLAAMYFEISQVYFMNKDELYHAEAEKQLPQHIRDALQKVYDAFPIKR